MNTRPIGRHRPGRPRHHRDGRRAYRAACALALLLALDAPADSQPADDPAADLLAADRAFAELSARTDPRTAFAEFLAPDAIMLPRAGEPAVGHAAAIASFGDEAGYALHWQPQFAEVASAGDLGWTWGHYQVVVDGAEVSTGKYVNVWKRQPDGRWKVRMDIGNQAPATPPE